MGVEMTVAYGIGMFFYGMGCIAIGAIVAYKIINRRSPEERENEEYLKELKKKLWSVCSF